jgi:hypothetical protein
MRKLGMHHNVNIPHKGQQKLLTSAYEQVLSLKVKSSEHRFGPQ